MGKKSESTKKEYVKESDAGSSGDEKPTKQFSNHRSKEGSRRKYTRKTTTKRSSTDRGRGRKRSSPSKLNELVSSKESEVVKEEGVEESVALSTVAPKDSKDILAHQEKARDFLENPMPEA